MIGYTPFKRLCDRIAVNHLDQRMVELANIFGKRDVRYDYSTIPKLQKPLRAGEEHKIYQKRLPNHASL
jgi:hypothetical protein